MRIRKHSRIVALALALVMILPLISIPTFAEDAVETPAYSFSENFDAAQDVYDALNKKPTLSSLENGALRVEYAAYSDDKYWAKTGQDDSTEITDVTVNEQDNTLTGKVTIGGVVYDIEGPINNIKGVGTAATSVTKADDQTAYTGGTLMIYTTAANDAWKGGWNVGTQSNVKVPAVDPAQYGKIYLSVDYYFSADVNSGAGFEVTWNTVSKAGKNQRLDLGVLTAGADYVTFAYHGDAESTLDGENTIRAPKETWVTLTAALDLTKGTAMIQFNGDYVRTITDDALTTGLKANEFNVLQISRSNTSNPDAMKGYVKVDNVSVTSTAPDVIYSNDFEQYAGMSLSNIKGGTYNGNFATTLPSKLEVVNEEDNTYFKCNIGADIQPGSELDTALFAYTGYTKWEKNAALKAAGDSAYNRETGILTVDGQDYPITPASAANIAVGMYGTFEYGGSTYTLTTGLYAAETSVWDTNVDRAITVQVPPISGADYSVVYYSADYYIEPGSSGGIHLQFQQVEGAERSVMWGINLANGYTGVSNIYLPIGRWANLTVKIDMATGAITYYLNGVDRYTNTNFGWGGNIDISRSTNEPNTSSRLHVLKTGKNAGAKGSISVDNVKFTTVMPEFDYLAYEDFEGFENGAAPTTAFSNIQNANTTVSDEKGSKAWKVTFNNTDNTASGTDDTDVNIDKNPTILMAGTDYLKTPSVVYEADYYIEEGTVGQLQVQMHPMKFNGTPVNWTHIYYVDFKSATSAPKVTSGSGAIEFARGEWITVSTVFDMVTSNIEVYVNGYLVTSRKLSDTGNLSFDDSKLIMGKVNKEYGFGTFYMDNIKVFAGTDPTKKVNGTVMSQDFESFELGTEPTAAFNGIGATGSTVTDVRGSKAWAFNHKNVGSTDPGDTGDLNIDINPYPKHPGLTHKTAPSIVLEADYFIEEGATGVFQSQIYALKYNDGAGPATWIDLYQVKFANASSSATLETESGDGYGFASMAVGRWNTVSCVIDLKTGDVDMYLNGNFAFGYNLATRYTTKLPSDATNFSFDANQWIVSKVNKYLGEGTLYTDNLKMYTGTAPEDAATDTFTYEEFDYVTDGSSAARAAFPTVPSLLTFKKEANGNVALRLDMDASTSSDEVWIVRSDSNDCLKTFTRKNDIPGDEGTYDAISFSADNGKFYNGEGELEDTHKYVYEDEYVVYVDDVTSEDGDDDYVGEYIEMTDAHDDSKTYKFWILPGDLAEAVYGGGNVGTTNACVYNAKTLSHSDAKTAILETDLFIEENSTGIVESQFTGYTYDKDGVETDGGWLQIFHLHLNEHDRHGEHFKAGQLGGQGGTNYGVCAKIGEWNNVKVLVDLETGVFNVYLNGVLARVYDCGNDNITITAPWSVVKVQRTNSPTTPVYEGGVLIDNVRVSTEGVPTSTFEKAPDWFLSEEAFNLFTADLITQVEGASIRLSTPAGLRFASYVDGKKVEYLERAFGDKVTKGTLIAPENYVAAAGDATRTALDALKAEHNLTNAYIDVKFDGVYFRGDASLNVGDNKCMAGSIVKILATNITREFAGFGYIEIEGVASFYADASIRSVQDVAIAARAAHDQALEADGVGLYDADELAIIDTYAAGEWIDFGEN